MWEKPVGREGCVCENPVWRNCCMCAKLNLLGGIAVCVRSLFFWGGGGCVCERNPLGGIAVCGCSMFGGIAVCWRNLFGGLDFDVRTYPQLVPPHPLHGSFSKVQLLVLVKSLV